MEQREKLIELIKTAFENQENDKCQGCDVYDCAKCVSVYIADYLTANGVVVLPCRCGECMHRRPSDNWCAVMGWFCHSDDGYCNCAERKGGDE